LIRGTGIDIVDVGRMVSWLDDPGLLERYFSPREIDYVRSRGKGAPASLAARFAAKEAFGKALGRGLKGISLRDIEVTADRHGRPELSVTGRAEKALRENGGNRIHLSLSHDATMAIAQVIIEEAAGG